MTITRTTLVPLKKALDAVLPHGGIADYKRNESK